MVKSVLAQSQVSAFKHDMLDDFLSHVNINMVSTPFFARGVHVRCIQGHNPAASSATSCDV